MGISRRKFLIASGVVGGGLILGIGLGGKPPVPGTIAGSFQPNAFLQITPDGRVVFQLHKAEMGQGVITSLPTILGEELDFDPANFDIELSGVHPDYNDPNMQSQMTGGSTSIPGSWDILREAGAAARAMLIAAAASRWQIPVGQCSTDNGFVINSNNGERLAYADVAEQARRFADVDYQLKARSDYRWIGTPMARLDAIAKSTGTAEFGVDVNLPGMKTAVVVRCPHFGGSVKSWDSDSISDIDGIVASFPIHSGIAIVADGYWPARKAAGQLAVQWDKGPLAGLNSALIREQQQQALAEQDPHWAVEEGDPEILASSANTLKAEYSAPFTHHSPMEPQNATALYTADVDGDRCEVWAPNQAPDMCQALAAQYADVARDKVKINSTLLGGAFGRRGYPDFVCEAAAIAKQLPGVPVKVQWSREDDMQHDFYRPATYHGMQGALDADGKLLAWEHKLVSSSIIKGFAVNLMSTMLPAWVPTNIARSMGRFMGDSLAGFDPTTAEGAHLPYQIPNQAVGQIDYDSGVPNGFWRSVGYSHNCFAVEAFMDELAHAANADPVAFRMDYLDPASRHAAVLKKVVEAASWGQTAAGIFQGVAVVEPFKSYCAMVVEVSVAGNSFKVERVVTAVDCGIVVNPAIVVAQIESAIVYALSAALKAPVTIDDGAVVQSNFHDLPVLRMNEVPVMDVHIIDSGESPTGIGEIGVPAVAPALSNALFAATGKRLRDMPFKLS